MPVHVRMLSRHRDGPPCCCTQPAAAGMQLSSLRCTCTKHTSSPVCPRYEQYDKPMNKRRETKTDDPFEDEFDTIEYTITDLNQVCHTPHAKHT